MPKAALLAVLALLSAAASAQDHPRLKLSFVTLQCSNMLTAFAVMQDDTVRRYQSAEAPFAGFESMREFVEWLNTAPSYSSEAACPDQGAEKGVGADQLGASSHIGFWPIAVGRRPVSHPECAGRISEDFGYRLFVLCYAGTPP